MKQWCDVRKKDLIMNNEEMLEFLKTENVGHLAMKNPDGSPYIIPINYAFTDNKFVLHCASKGQKIENLKLDNKVCFEVAKRDDLVTKRVIAFGRVRFIDDFEMKSKLLYEFTAVFTNNREFSLAEKAIKRTCVLVIDVEHMTGEKK
jgi:nitroimidazol reductase NimA-like FMN-containing flavoprotein (pyridoxamine 5'-phosphate oxidase superfamily)